MLFKRYTAALLPAALFLFASCEEEGNHDVQTKIPVQCIFEPIITDMVESSIIAFPLEKSLEIRVINSKEELHGYMPREILEAHPLYEDVNFNSSSLISLTTRAFYKPYNIQYTIVKNSEGVFVVTQNLYYTSEFYEQGYFVMSNFVIDKINSDSKIEYLHSGIWQ